MSAHHLLDNCPKPLPSPEEVARALASGSVCPMPGTRYVVATLGQRHALSLSELIFDLAVKTRFALLLVGVEDNDAIRADPGRLVHYASRGAATAVRGRSLIPDGPNGDVATEFVRRELVHLVVDERFGSDPDLWTIVSRRVGKLTSAQSAHAMLIGRGRRILNGEQLRGVTPASERGGAWRRRLRRVLPGRSR